MNNQLAVTVLIKGNSCSTEKNLLKESLMNQYNTNKVIILQNTPETKLVITNLITNETTVI